MVQYVIEFERKVLAVGMPDVLRLDVKSLIDLKRSRQHKLLWFIQSDTIHILQIDDDSIPTESITIVFYYGLRYVGWMGSARPVEIVADNAGL